MARSVAFAKSPPYLLTVFGKISSDYGKLEGKARLETCSARLLETLSAQSMKAGD
jgi:hypothetical protein